MSHVHGSRETAPRTAATRQYRRRHPGPDASVPRYGISRLLAGLGLAVAVIVLGLIAKTGSVSSFDLRIDQHIAAQDRTGALTTAARAISNAATPETIGIALIILVPLIFLLARRRLTALKVFCMFAGAYVLTEIGKVIVGEHRPPVSLQAMPADSGASYPSGHAAIAAVLAVALVVVAATMAARSAAIVLAGAYAVAVAASRVYLADHFLLDVVGSVLCALAAGFIVTGLAALPVLQPYLRQIDTRRRH